MDEVMSLPDAFERPEVARIIGAARALALVTRRDLERYVRMVSRWLGRVRSSPGLRRAFRAADVRLSSSRVAPYLASFLHGLDAAAAWMRPRLSRFEAWASSLSRQEKAAIAVTAVSILFLGRAMTALPPLRVVPTGRLEVGAFFENGWGGAFPSSFPALHRLAKETGGRGADVIYPVWHTVMPDGSVESVPVREVLEYCRLQGIAVVPVVTNHKLPAGDNSGVLKERAAMARALENLAREVEDNGYDGLNLSFQLVSPAYKARLTEFATARRAAN
ncbi:MAG: hypothetical protein NUV93_09315, partial [Firmicutes bacterium]|nr:hypothetical protein [Bacillota bacterium]